MKSFEEGVVSGEITVDLVCCVRVDVYSNYILRKQLLGMGSSDTLQEVLPWNLTILWICNSAWEKYYSPSRVLPETQS